MRLTMVLVLVIAAVAFSYGGIGFGSRHSHRMSAQTIGADAGFVAHFAGEEIMRYMPENMIPRIAWREVNNT